MKSYIASLFAAMLLAGIFVSCQKELSPEDIIPGPTTPTTADSSTYIDRIRYTEVDRNGLDSFTYVDQYQYDAGKRLVRISRDSMYLSPGNLSYVSLYTYTTDFFYNGADTMPYKKLTVFDNLFHPQGSRYSETNWYFYMGNRLLKDSAISASVQNFPPSTTTDTAVALFRYAPGRIFIERSDGFSDEFDTLQLDARENIINSKTYDSFGALEFETIVTYDNKPNPLIRYKPFYRYIIFGPEPNEDEMNGFNNYASIKNYHRSSGSLLLVDEAYTYQYNALGLPVRQSVNNLGPLNKTVRQFYYKKP
jgi:hypothetical protein